jgi:hypothetical protein
MPTSPIPSPKRGRALVDEYFIENRTRLLEIAAYLDRLDRADEPPDRDFRMVAFRAALNVLCAGEAPRVDRIQMILSDPTPDPLPVLDTKSARGAYDPGEGGR